MQADADQKERPGFPPSAGKRQRLRWWNTLHFCENESLGDKHALCRVRDYNASWPDWNSIPQEKQIDARSEGRARLPRRSLG